MPTFEIVIEETQAKIVKVEAETLDEAESKVKEQYRNGKIVITEMDYQDYKIRPL